MSTVEVREDWLAGSSHPLPLAEGVGASDEDAGSHFAFEKKSGSAKPMLGIKEKNCV